MPQVVDKMGQELRSSLFWKACLAEFVGTMLFVFLGLGSTATFGQDVDWVRISLAFGLGIATMVHCTAHISGGHINPAVTLGFLVTHAITPLRAVLYILAQVLGAMAGAGVLRAITYPGWSGGPNVPGPGISDFQALIMEVVLTFQLVLTVFSTVDPDRKGFTGSGPLAIGLAVVLGHLCGVQISGASMNPARTIGSAVISGTWDSHWVYWIGPIVGGILAASIYDIILAPTSDRGRLRKCVSCEYGAVDKEEPMLVRDIDMGIINGSRPADDSGNNRM